MKPSIMTVIHISHLKHNNRPTYHRVTIAENKSAISFVKAKFMLALETCFLDREKRSGDKI